VEDLLSNNFSILNKYGYYRKPGREKMYYRETCYLIQFFELESNSLEFIELPIPLNDCPFCAEEEERENEKIKQELSLDDQPLINLGIFACRNFERAREIMLDSDLIRTDWISCYSESDSEGRIYELFLSTSRKYICRIMRTEIY